MHKTIFISDLHLAKHHPELTQVFFKFVDYCVAEAQIHTIDSIYILGDFFNYWIGNDSIESWHDDIIQALNKLSAISKVYFLVGNRDFQMDSRSAEIFNLVLIPQDIKKLTIYDHPILLLHGDTLCTNDVKYQKFRRIARTRLAKLIYMALPLSMRRNIAEGLKKQSTRNYEVYRKDPAVFDVVESEVSQLFSEHQCNIMIHGHTHHPKVHEYSNNQFRYVLGDWHKNGAYYLEIAHDPNNNQTDFQLKFFQ